MEGAPSTDELIIMTSLCAVFAVSLLCAVRLVTGYFSASWQGPVEPSPWRLATSLALTLTGAASAWLLWLRVEHIAARMGIATLVLVMLLLAEGPEPRRRRR
jgi:hypothetical protein